MKGQILIEVIVALGIAVVILSSITIAGINALNNTQFTKNQTTAAHYAEQGMELVRSQKGIIGGQSSTTYCIQETANQPTLVSTSPCPTIGGFFTSQIVIDRTTCSDNSGVPSVANFGTATVTVFWTDSKCVNVPNCHKSQLVSCMNFN